MPEKLDRCVNGLLAKWRADPGDAPKRYRSGDEWKRVESEDDLKSAAFGICRASTDLQEGYMDEVRDAEARLTSMILDEDGDGPVLRGVAAVNRPYLKFMRPLELVTRDGIDRIRAQIVRFGIYKHPKGPDGKLPFTREFWQRVIDNFRKNVYGQKVFMDKAHDPNAGSLGEVVELEVVGDGVDAIIDPTDAGRNAVSGRSLNYASIDLVFNHQGNLVAMAASEMPELEEVDIAGEVFANIVAQAQLSEEVSMKDNDKGAAPDPTTPTAATLPEEVQLKLDAKLAEMQTQLDEQRAKLDEDRALFEQEQARRREEIRREKVKVFLSEIDQPKDGRRLDLAVHKIIGSILLGDSVELDGDASIELSEDGGVASVHAYYREAVEALATKVPRTVPVEGRIETRDERPASVNLSGARAHRRDSMIMAKTDSLGRMPTEAELAEIDEKLDRIFGEEG